MATRLQHIPDILDCLAQLSNDEVPTPPTLAREMLDLLPGNVWSEPDYKWLDPSCKSGVFLREAAARLLEGLADWEPDFEKRREHVYREMLWGAAITEMTGIVARRTVYCSRDASGKHSVVPFAREEGNLPFIPAEHQFAQNASGEPRGTCVDCGASEELERGDGRENYAYSFIHEAYPTEEMKGMKFDVIVGNPPFQIGDGGGGGGASATPLYHRFVERAMELEPRHIVMITPSRWFSGGKGLDDFRARMLSDKRFVTLVDHPRLYDCFPGVKIRGGVSYFLWSREHDGPCSVTTKVGDEEVGPTVSRLLGAYDVLVRRNEAVRILDKVTAHRVDGEREKGIGDQVSARKPFGLASTFRGQESSVGLTEPVLVHGTQSTSWTERENIVVNSDWIDEWKVLLVKAHGTSGREDLTILGEPIVAGPGEACSETYLVVGHFAEEELARNLAAYSRTRFFRFLVSLRKITQNITRNSYRFVPALPLDRVWTDEDLYNRYGLSDDDRAFIESMIKERPDDAAGVVELDDDEELD
jgi:site-specific DNA-methyltransferase (adenine-specific)